jgi:hypothetical protein
MEKVLVILLTVVLFSISYGLLSPDPLTPVRPLSPSIPTQVEVTLRFAEHLQTDPSSLRALEKRQEVPSPALDPESLRRNLLSRGKNIPGKPYALGVPGATRTLHMKSLPEPIQFSSDEEWIQWLHEKATQSGASFLEDVVPDEGTHSNLIDALETLAQIEREPELLKTLGRFALDLAENHDLVRSGSPSPSTLRLLELYSKILPEQDPIRNRMMVLLNRVH